VFALALAGMLARVVPIWVPLVLFAAAIGANAHLFALFRRANGTLFALGAILFHQFHYLYASAAFLACRLGWVPARSRPST
jgi:hypothetical protein